MATNHSNIHSVAHAIISHHQTFALFRLETVLTSNVIQLPNVTSKSVIGIVKVADRASYAYKIRRLWSNDSTRTPPTFRKRRCTDFRPCPVSKFARFAPISFSYQMNFWDLVGHLHLIEDKKIEPRCGIDTRARGSGHGYYLLLRKVLKFC